MATFGYAGKILRLDLSSGKTSVVPTVEYSRFIGGRGIGAKIYWDEVPPQVGAFDAENRLIFTIGPLTGLHGLGSSRWQVCGKTSASARPQFCYCNLGGNWGAELRFAGFDGIIVQGQAERPVYLFLHNSYAELKDASFLWGKGAIETREILKRELGKSVRVATIGPAGENRVVFATLLADQDSSGSGGLGALMGSKKLKAIVVKGSQRSVEVAQPERLGALIKHYRNLKRVRHDLMPSHWGSKKAPCYGCSGCIYRNFYKAENGKKGKFMCHSAAFYQPWAMKYYGEWNDVPFHATKLIDSYGLDSKVMDLMMSWIERCREAGILNEDNTGIPISKMGSLEFMESLVKQVSFRKGLGALLAQGLTRAAEFLGSEAKVQLDRIGYLARSGYRDFYSPRLYIPHALFYAMEPRLPIQQLHEMTRVVSKWLSWVKESQGAVVSPGVVRAIAERFWGSETAADFTTYEGKALAAKLIQDRQMAKECLILCDHLWPITELECAKDHVGDPTLESQILSSVTGEEIDEAGLYGTGETVLNLQRAILVREGRRGRDDDTLPDYYFTMPLEYDAVNPECLVPGKDGEAVSRKGAVLDRGEFERMKNEYYKHRKWDVDSGLQTRTVLEDLGLKDIAEDLEKRGLTAKDPE